ncbi:hypothetical protein HLPCO_001956 [Haloplasma contractile SSD-17B]|uniref:Uncharacterized protein n=1 Tax=Haloplasma contractile SSD-17B TaxID=1033810 RepID=U2DUG7_9MOLU|nr:hypothetical protein HLPCO_001956 [Haloplasma contractile SSD-17B]
MTFKVIIKDVTYIMVKILLSYVIIIHLFIILYTIDPLKNCWILMFKHAK